MPCRHFVRELLGDLLWRTRDFTNVRRCGRGRPRRTTPRTVRFCFRTQTFVRVVGGLEHVFRHRQFTTDDRAYTVQHLRIGERHCGAAQHLPGPDRQKVRITWACADENDISRRR